MASLPIGEGIVPQHIFPEIQIDPPLPGQTTIGGLPSEIILRIFRELPPPSSSTTCYNTTCQAFADYYTEKTLRTATALLLMNKQTRLLERCGIPCNIQTYEDVLNLVENTKKIILHANKYLPEHLKFKSSAGELMANCEELQNFLTQADDYNLEQCLGDNIHCPENATLAEKANLIRKWMKTGEVQAITWLNLNFKQFFWLPIEVCELVNLRWLDASYNHFIFLPSDIGKLKNLKTLWLVYNSLSSLPIEFAQLKNLENAYLFLNKFRSLPPAFNFLPKSVSIHIGENQITPQTPGMKEATCEIKLDREEDYVD